MNKNLMKISRVVFELCEWTDRQTYILIAILRAHPGAKYILREAAEEQTRVDDGQPHTAEGCEDVNMRGGTTIEPQHHHHHHHHRHHREKPFRPREYFLVHSRAAEVSAL